MEYVYEQLLSQTEPTSFLDAIGKLLHGVFSFWGIHIFLNPGYLVVLFADEILVQQ